MRVTKDRETNPNRRRDKGSLQIPNTNRLLCFYNCIRAIKKKKKKKEVSKTQ